MTEAGGQGRIIRVDLDEEFLSHPNRDVEHERRVAIYDLVDSNVFVLEDGPEGPYVVKLRMEDNRLILDVRDEGDVPLRAFHLSFSPFRTLMKDYFIMHESYHEAIRNASPSRIEAIDMGRRAVHNEASELLAERLKGKIHVDFDTARRLFTLMCALKWRV
jgi:uncharacterized protein (UPF0262 family)